MVRRLDAVPPLKVPILLFANIKKELLLLSRDRVSLLVLFVMPMLLVLILSLIQDDLFRATGETTTIALFVNNDTGTAGAELRQELETNGALELVAAIDGEAFSSKQARQAVFDGTYQFAIIVPPSFTTDIDKIAEASVLAGLLPKCSY